MENNNAIHKAAATDESSHSKHWFLKEAAIESFGMFGQRHIGPFADGLNVVYGENEAGKSTLAAFITGVLFGWAPARGKRNSYRPQGGERAGSLVFGTGDGSSAHVSRRRNADGLQGDAWLAEDVDANEYERLFALNADELRSLDKGPALVSQLLTAGSGTLTSPSAVRQQLSDELKGYFSRSASRPDSLVSLQSEIAEARATVMREQEKADELRRLHMRHQALQQQKEQIDRRLKRQNTVVERLKAQVSLVESLERQRDDLLVQERALSRDAREQAGWNTASRPESASESCGSSERGAAAQNGAALTDALTDPHARAAIDRLYEKQIRLEQDVKAAQDNLDSAVQRNETLQQDDAFLNAASKERRTRKLQSVASVLLPLAILLIGVPVFVYGQSLASMTVTAFGVALIVAGVLAAIAALVALVRPNQSDDLVAQRRADAQWVVDKDRERLRVCEKTLQDHRAHSASVLQSMGLERFGSVAAVRDEMNRAYADSGNANASSGNRARIDEVRESARRIQAQIDGILADAGADDIVALDNLATHMVAQRDELQQEVERCNNQMGRSAQRLREAQDDYGLARAQQHLQDLETRFADSEASYARTLLAHRALSEAIDSWQAHTQPLVYRQASELFSMMTDGAWHTVRPRGEDALEVVGRNGKVLAPELLSLGTCQQLYLALRIALLLVAEDVGRNVPVLADDILVNFDDTRRMAAARALAQLSGQRQVIIFTGQKQLVREMQQLSASVNVVTLARTQRPL